MTATTDLSWMVRHEIRLAWRDWFWMLTAGKVRRTRNVTLGLILFAAVMHLPAYAVVGRFANLSPTPDKTTLIVMSASILLAWALMLSQAMESVTRVFYARADLDLIMSSPATLANVFSIRMAAIALTVTAMALLLSAPFVNVLVLAGGAHWLAAYGLVIAIGLSAAAMAIAFTVTLFRAIGPKRTRLVAQILAAIIGAGFVIALQIAAITTYGTLSRFAVLTSDTAAALAPDANSALWWPVRAVLGDRTALLLLMGFSVTLLGITMASVSSNFADHVVSASTVGPTSRPARGVRSFRHQSRRQALRRKELILLRRDPWLVSQTLMQLLYLVPPAVMLWRSFSDHSGATMLVTPVIVMAAGQLSGGLAWLTICGEDASDLVATAPLQPSSLIRAKVEVVLIVIGILFAPLVLALLFASPLQAIVTALAIAAATISATAIQLWFRVQARRSQFRRRQTSSRVATFAEAFSSIGWAATAGLTLSLPIAAIITAAMICGLLAATWKISPARKQT